MTWANPPQGANKLAGSTLRSICGLSIVVGLLLLGGSPAAAHTDLLQASPGVGQRTGGDVNFVDMVFSEPVSDVKITVTNPSGKAVAGSMLVDQGSVVSYGFEQPIVESGRYTVAYTMTSFDLDFTTQEIFFDYEESAPQPFRIGVDGRYIIEPPGRNWLSLLSTLLLAISVIGVALMLIYRQGFFRSSSSPAALEGEAGEGDEPSHEEGDGPAGISEDDPTSIEPDDDNS